MAVWLDEIPEHVADRLSERIGLVRQRRCLRADSSAGLHGIALVTES